MRALAAAALAAASFFLPVLGPSTARAQSLQVFVNDVFVASQHAACMHELGFVPPQVRCPIFKDPPTNGANISNDPEIQFEANSEQALAGLGRCNVADGGTPTGLPGDFGYNVCNDAVFLCAQVAIGGLTGTLSIDSIEFDVFRLVDGANPLDPGSTPPLKTFFISDPGSVDSVANRIARARTPATRRAGTATSLRRRSRTACSGTGRRTSRGQNGKINGQYGFRVTAQTNQVGQSGNITITQVAAYPAGSTEDANGITVAQLNLTVDVTDVHVINSTPTIVGQITGRGRGTL